MSVEWKIEKKLVKYPDATAYMEQRITDIYQNKESEMIWMLEHPDIYTAGTSAETSDLLDKNLFPVYKSGRGGKYTYHGPGQLVIYTMLDLNRRNLKDIKLFIYSLEQMIIDVLACFKIKGERRENRVGIWVVTDGNIEAKIAAIGIRIRRWITFHGVSININPNLSHFKGIVPCGLGGSEYGVTSFEHLNISCNKEQIYESIKDSFQKIFDQNYPFRIN